MADLIDAVNRGIVQESVMLSKQLAERQYEIPPGTPGTCEECEKESPRLINGHCARCRDMLGMD